MMTVSPSSLLTDIYMQMDQAPRRVQCAVELIDAHAKTLSEKERYKIFKAATKKDPHLSAEKFLDFKIVTAKYRYRSARCVAKINAFALTSHFEHFLPLKTSKRYKIAECAINDIENLRFPLLHFQKFRLNAEQAFTLAMKSAQADGALSTEYFRNFGIEVLGQDRVFQVVHAAFTQNAYGSAKFMSHFDALLDEKQRFDLLMLRLAADPDKALELAQRYRVSAEPFRLQAASLNAASDGWRFSAQVQKWNFGEEKSRLSLALTAMRNHLAGALRYHANYQLSRDSLMTFFQEAIREKMDTKNDYVELIESLQAAGMSPDDKYQLASNYAEQHPVAYLKEAKNWGFDEIKGSSLDQIAQNARKE